MGTPCKQKLLKMLESLENLSWNVVSILRDICQRNSRQKQLRAIPKSCNLSFFFFLMQLSYSMPGKQPILCHLLWAERKRKIDLLSQKSLSLASKPEKLIEFMGDETNLLKRILFSLTVWSRLQPELRLQELSLTGFFSIWENQK